MGTFIKEDLHQKCSELLKILVTISSHFTVKKTERKGKQLVVKRMNTEKSRNFGTYHGWRGPIIWNALSNNLREGDKLVSFKKKLKTNLKTLEQIVLRKGTNCI